MPDHWPLATRHGRTDPKGREGQMEGQMEDRWKEAGEIGGGWGGVG